MKRFEQIIIANWKMQLSVEEAKKLAESLKNLLGGETGLSAKQVVVCPDFLSLVEVASIIKDSGLILGAQDGFYEAAGPFTGQVSLQHLKDLGCQYVILGHSEKRALGETDKSVNLKVKSALTQGLAPIICVGETFEERQEGNKGTVIMHQVYEALQGVQPIEGQNIIIAYEPVWVIGSGQAISGQEAAQTAAMIRQSYVDAMDGQYLEALSVIYGGSVDSDNIRSFTSQTNIQGALVGSSSLKSKVFADLVKNA